MNDRNIKIINDPDATALKLMLEEKPSFVAGWLSTTLCEAHLHGIAPICLENLADPKFILLHQFYKKSIHWAESKKLLDESLANNIDTFEMLKHS